MAEKMNLFDIVNGIFEKRELLSEEDIALNYKPFIINRAMSNYKDLIFLAEEMNMNWQLNPLMQYHFYYFGVDKLKRFSKWPKRDEELDDKIDLLKEYYDYSTLRARETIPVIDSLGLWDVIKVDLNKGGRGDTVRTSTKAKSKSKKVR